MWVKIDDGMATHPKLLKAGPLALAIQIRAICYASQNMTDGVIPVEAVPLLLTGLNKYGIELGGCEWFSTGCQADELQWPNMMIEYGLWDAHESGYIIHDYLEWNVSKSEREKWKSKLSRSGKKGMKSRWNKEKSDITKVITKDITSIDNQPITMQSTSTSTSSSLNSLHSSVSGFDLFWKVYPRKVGKDAARKVWAKRKDKPPVIHLTEAIQRAKETEQWKKDGGQYIPHPATWLSEGRWDDEPTEVVGMSDPNGFLAGMKSFIERG